MKPLYILISCLLFLGVSGSEGENSTTSSPSTSTETPFSSTGTPSTETPFSSTGTPSTETPSTGTPSTGTPSTETPPSGEVVTQQLLNTICAPTPFIITLPVSPYRYIPPYELGYKCSPVFGISSDKERFCESEPGYPTTTKIAFRRISRYLNENNIVLRTVMNHTKCIFTHLE